ncbi:VWA domain-containing protein [Hymenobacter sp. 15J16-1T3B]|uniref:vWA domain-containing protein n=1 Tax=Hymenobacter sp. 15J16-1T3B TaxID=2886941 RepID=UPI001D100F04|nr:VWA domain-containing protein [Hymenobacter sp. 15J16-1T3B]MCC3157647.1 VWA domain-containing protein [Hymenobacter sp. 15J16-1T3B]
MRITLLVAVCGATLALPACQSAYDDSGSAGPAGAAYTGAGSPSNGGGSAPAAGVITAGEWRDLSNWGFWQTLAQKPEWQVHQGRWQLFTTKRYTLTLTDAAGQPLAGAQVRIGSAPATTGVTAAVTDRQGQAELFPTMFSAAPVASNPLPITVEYRGQTFTPAPVQPNEVAAARTVAVTASAAAPVDVMFVVDATGSMGDEISYLKTELRDVITRAAAQLPAADLRLASVFYRDQGDAYVTRTQPFTTDASQLLAFVQNQQADGGGDFPEAVEEALTEALRQQWSAEARCRLLFLVLDAPPHDAAAARMQQLIRQAAQQGVRLIPVTASGIDQGTEYLMRAGAIGTGGTYVFITNHSGIGNAHLEASVGDYQVEYLNNLLVRLITQYSQP